MFDIYGNTNLPGEVETIIKDARKAKELGNVTNEADLLKVAAEKSADLSVEYTLTAWIWRYCADAYYRSLNIIDCIRSLDKSIIYFKQSNDLDGECLQHIFLSTVYLQSGDFVDALEELGEADKIACETANHELHIQIKQTWALYYSHIGEYDEAIMFYKDVVNEYVRFKKEPVADIGACYINIGLSYACSGKVDEAISYHKKAIEFSRQFNSDDINKIERIGQYVIINSKIALADTYNKYNMCLKESISLLEDALVDCFRFSLLHYEHLIRMSLADTFQLKRMYSEAKEQLLIVREQLTSNPNTRKKSDVLLKLAKLSAAENNTTETISFFDEYSELIIQDQYNVQKQRAVELEVRLFRLQEKRKNELLERELLIKQRVNEAITFQNTKNEEFLQKVHRKLSQIESKILKSQKKEIKELQEEINDTLSLRKEWINFEQGYVNSKNELEIKLSKQFPTLTSTERKMCILLQAGRSTKEIASLLHVSPNTVDTHRIHIRRKMGLPPKTSILSALSKL